MTKAFSICTEWDEQANGLTADLAMKPKPANALLRVGLKAVERAAFAQALAKATDLRPAAQSKDAE